jgi:hypothetical protein
MYRWMHVFEICQSLVHGCLCLLAAVMR